MTERAATALGAAATGGVGRGRGIPVTPLSDNETRWSLRRSRGGGLDTLLGGNQISMDDSFYCRSRRRSVTVEECLSDYMLTNGLERKRAACRRCPDGKRLRVTLAPVPPDDADDEPDSDSERPDDRTSVPPDGDTGWNIDRRLHVIRAVLDGKPLGWEFDSELLEDLCAERVPCDQRGDAFAGRFAMRDCLAALVATGEIKVVSLARQAAFISSGAMYRRMGNEAQRAEAALEEERMSKAMEEMFRRRADAVRSKLASVTEPWRFTPDDLLVRFSDGLRRDLFRDDQVVLRISLESLLDPGSLPGGTLKQEEKAWARRKARFLWTPQGKDGQEPQSPPSEPGQEPPPMVGADGKRCDEILAVLLAGRRVRVVMEAKGNRARKEQVVQARPGESAARVQIRARDVVALERSGWTVSFDDPPQQAAGEVRPEGISLPPARVRDRDSRPRSVTDAVYEEAMPDPFELGKAFGVLRCVQADYDPQSLKYKLIEESLATIVRTLGDAGVKVASMRI